MKRVSLGGAWASVHVGAGIRDMLKSCLDHGFTGIVPAPALRPLDWRGVAAELRDLPFEIPAIRVEDPRNPENEGLGSAVEGDWERFVARVEAAAALGRRLDCSLLILEAPRGSEDEIEAEGGRERLLEICCRNLHELARRLPEYGLALTEAEGALCDPEALELIFCDLSRYAIGYWHHPALAAKICGESAENPGERLEKLRKFLVGCDLTDFSGGRVDALPGTGGVDYGLLAPYMRGLRLRLPTVLEPDPETSWEDLRQVRSFLEKHGL